MGRSTTAHGWRRRRSAANICPWWPPIVLLMLLLFFVDNIAVASVFNANEIDSTTTNSTKLTSNEIDSTATTLRNVTTKLLLQPDNEPSQSEKVTVMAENGTQTSPNNRGSIKYGRVKPQKKDMETQVSENQLFGSNDVGSGSGAVVDERLEMVEASTNVNGVLESKVGSTSMKTPTTKKSNAELTGGKTVENSTVTDVLKSEVVGRTTSNPNKELTESTSGSTITENVKTVKNGGIISVLETEVSTTTKNANEELIAKTVENTTDEETTSASNADVTSSTEDYHFDLSK